MKFLFALLCCALSVGLRAESPLRLSGSTTVKGALEHRLAELERELGRKVELNGTGSNAGIVGLLAGSADVAMISSPLAEVLKKLNVKTPGGVDPSLLQVAAIGTARIAFIVNPKNPVRKLSTAQLTAVLTGVTKNWREVGGPDLPIVVVSLAHGSSLLQEKLTHGTPLAADARKVPNAAQISPVVSQETGAIGIISTSHVRGKTSLIETDASIETPLFLVTIGAPTPEQQKLIAAARKLLTEVG